MNSLGLLYVLGCVRLRELGHPQEHGGELEILIDEMACDGK